MGHPHYSPSELASLRADSADYDDATPEEMEAAYAFMMGLTVEQYREQAAASTRAYLAKTDEIDRLVRGVNFAATYADREENMQRLKALVGEPKALKLVYE